MDVTAIAAGGSHTCALLWGHTVRCWGDNSYGQLGNGSGLPGGYSSTSLAVSGLSNAVAITAGFHHTCALLGDATVKCWGENDVGQLGNGRTTNSSTPVPVGGLNPHFVAIAAGIAHTCAPLSDGTSACWGWNNLAQLGDGTKTERHKPQIVIHLFDAVAFAAGYSHTCALLGDGTAACWGANPSGQLGDGTTTDSTTPVAVCATGATAPCTAANGNILTGALAIAAGYDDTCALLGDGTVKCWGDNSSGQLGNGSERAYSSTPVVVQLRTNAVAITAGFYHNCALLGDGTAACWGDNANGQLGDGTTTERSWPYYVCATGDRQSGSCNNLTGVVAISAGGSHTCALLSDGNAQCWGANASGQLGDGTTTERHNPAGVTGLSHAVAIAAGQAHNCALLGDGTAACWGANNLGQLGDGTTTDRHTPVAVSNLIDAITVAAGGAHTCALLDDSTAACWGENNYGQLGDGTTTNSSIPVAVVPETIPAPPHSASVGGKVMLPPAAIAAESRGSAEESGWSAGAYAALAVALSAAFAALGVGGWYGRRRWR